MKISSRALGAVAASVVAAALWSPMALAAASFGPGGTITFKGTIVAPPYDIASYVLDNYQGFHTEKLGVKHESTIDVTFTPAPDTSPAAHIAVLVNTDAGVAAPHTLKTRFTDNENRITLAARAEYSVGHAGGTLSIVAGAPAERAVTVLVSYD
jgi:type 1 fimbria pilin